MKKISLTLFAGVMMAATLCAQQGYSSASYSRGKMWAEQLVFPDPSEVIVEEFMNYHKHDLPIPKKQGEVNLDIRFENGHLATGQRTWMQIGISTAEIADRDNLPPINLGLVVDKSGSMAGRPIEHAREALRTLVEMLRPEDMISIIAFDHGVEVVLPATKLKDPAAVLAAIDRIQTGGSTNLNLGMVTGYREVIRNYLPKGTNKIIMLTDALTNTGVVDPREMVRNSGYYNKELSVQMALVGLGQAFNSDLSRKITGTAGSSIHFIHDSQDIEKVFIEELESMVAPVGESAILSIAPNADLEILDVMGYDPAAWKGKTEIDLNNLNSGLTQVVLVEVRKKGENPSVAVELGYKDLDSGKFITQQKSAQLSSADVGVNSREQRDIQKNKLIGEMALCLKSLKEKDENGSQNEVKVFLDENLARVRAIYPAGRDEDIDRIASILEQYASALATLAAQSVAE